MEKTFKWIGLGFIILVVFAVISGYKGGASSATSNYNKVMTGQD
jgi:uncharacterized membrane protein YukC